MFTSRNLDCFQRERKYLLSSSLYISLHPLSWQKEASANTWLRHSNMWLWNRERLGDQCKAKWSVQGFSPLLWLSQSWRMKLPSCLWSSWQTQPHQAFIRIFSFESFSDFYRNPSFLLYRLFSQLWYIFLQRRPVYCHFATYHNLPFLVWKQRQIRVSPKNNSCYEV